MLEVAGLESGYGRSKVLFGVDLAVAPGEMVTLMGRNGMGKTTLVKSVTGLVRPSGGRISLRGQAIHGLAAHRIGALGLGLVPEGRHVFPTLTVEENLVATAANRTGHAAPWTLQRVFALFPRLHERRRQKARTLSGGEQQMVAIGRALMINPHLLILDEATEGLAPLIRLEIWNCLERLKAEGQAILVIDKNIDHLMRIADRHYVMEKGRIVWSGRSDDLSRDKLRVEAYVGV
ncbi:ABC transporter ATP-binding protein [Azospirillum sp. BE72]|uniref:ABC transporter ATP-binding protein n=1 Tax=Azospirillum sp. BE72 TaxID=2817776 RepID=UPI002866570C|nr:ABC transporter ATP-binding protein [Azospirillum sp. BE72]MDR6775327.1 branched-chain amino acid transport system ATP-binding protein [Azospirillum sp. BE72]